MQIRRLLVANRGEIALRIFRACRELGIETVAVAAPDDRGALHARVGGRAGRDLVATSTRPSTCARRARPAPTRSIPATGSSPRAPSSPRRCEAAGLTWVGPPPAALRAGGDKLAAKETRARGRRAGRCRAARPEEIGFPLLVKAAAGGGGRGMRVVRAPEELEEALAAARREAAAAFGDDTVFCERYLERPRHVEIQLLADRHGNVAALGERDCSIQRRHQKVLEEAPSPALDPELRAADERRGGRLRARDRLRERGHRRVRPRRPRLLVPRAERADPGRAPGHGARDRRRHRARAAPHRRRASRSRPRNRLLLARGTRSRCGSTRRIRARSCPRPAGSSGCGCRRGSASTRASRRATRSAPRYDPLIAKLIAHGETRDGGARPARARRSHETEVGGVTTNLPFLRWLVAHPLVRAGRTTTAFLTENPPLSAPPAAAGPRAVGAAPGGSTSPARRPRRAPDVDAAAHEHGRRRRAERAHRADARHGDPRARRARATRSSRASRSSCSRR